MHKELIALALAAGLVLLNQKVRSSGSPPPPVRPPLPPLPLGRPVGGCGCGR